MKHLDETPGEEKCAGMAGIVKEGDKALKEWDEPIINIAIIGAARRVEHYEAAGYTFAINIAKQLGLDEVVASLETTLDEEHAADAKLAELCAALNSEPATVNDSTAHAPSDAKRENGSSKTPHRASKSSTATKTTRKRTR